MANKVIPVKSDRSWFSFWMPKKKHSEKEVAQYDEEKHSDTESSFNDSDSASSNGSGDFKDKLLSARDGTLKLNRKKIFKTSLSCADVPRALQHSETPVIPFHSFHNLRASSVMDITKSEHSSLYGIDTDDYYSSVHHLDAIPDPENLIPQNMGSDACQVLCKLCLMMVPVQNMHSLEDCGCFFCIACMQQYLYINIIEGNVSIMCPDVACPVKGKILIPEIHNLVGDEVFEKFQKFKLNNDVVADPCRSWCPTPGCETICLFQPSSEEDSGVAVHCLNCKFTFCSSCKLKWHGNSSCEEMKLLVQEDEEFLTSEGEYIIRRCPCCRVPIERDEGCAQMMCKCCRHLFCWHCLESLDDDILLRHYDRGPCKFKFGHSRSSMMWHRTRIIGIIAGISLLIFLTSPLLLLATPVLFCYRCKRCSFFYKRIFYRRH